LSNVKDIFDADDIFFWLEAGSLLGAIRDNDIIIGDNDADISFWARDSIKVFRLKSEFEKRGYGFVIGGSKFEIHNLKTNEHLVCLYPATIKNNYLIKLERTYILRRIGTWLHILNISCFDYLTWKLMIFFRLYTDAFVRCPAYIIGDFDTILFHKRIYNIPEHSESYLTFKYGNDWRNLKIGHKGFEWRLKELL